MPHAMFGAGPEVLGAFARAVDESQIDRVWVGDHVSFRGGQGYDGLLQSMALIALTRRVTVQTAVYLLPLRHPVPVARQVASLAEVGPGRFVFGVGVGGDDPDEVRACGVDPATRGARTDEALALVRRLLDGEVLTHAGPYFPLDGVRVLPAPQPRVPIVVGGRSGAALERAGRLADGWLGVFVEPDRYRAGVDSVELAASAAGRHGVAWRHGLLAWCGFGSSAGEARTRLAPAMEDLYRQPFARFARYAPCGDPEEVAAALRPYVAAGASCLLLAAVAATVDEVIDGVSHVRRLLRLSPARG